MIKEEVIKLKDCWYSVEKDEFRKIRSGLLVERSPMDKRDPRLKIANTFTVMQHNVLNWRSNKESLLTYYLQLSPDIMLINSHGLRYEDSLKIPGYKVHKINTTNSL